MRRTLAVAALPGSHWRWTVVLALLTLLYLLPRLSGLNRVVTVDEPLWLARSANFYRALWQGDLVHTFQHAHPGVMTMWAGMVGYWFAAPGYVDHFHTNLDNVFNIHERLRVMGLRELDVLVAARTAKIALQTALFALSLVWLRWLFGIAVAVVAGAIIALDPFLIAHDQLLQIDGLVTISSLAAVLALANAVTREQWRAAPWMIAGCLAALAWLTRITGLALIGVTGLALVMHTFSGNWRELGTRLRHAAIFGVLWLAAALVTAITLWPVLWVAPERALKFVSTYVTGAVAEGHEEPIYFMGEIHIGDPGILFYPVSMLWRLSLASSIGLVLVAVALVVPGFRRALPERVLRAGGLLLVFATVYFVGMMMGAKKFDRYVLPAHAILDVIAAIGLVATLRWVLPQRAWVTRAAIPAALGALLLAQAVVTLGYRPYYLVAYNPLLGGAESAEDVVRMGYGEGTDAAARWVLENAGGWPTDQTEDLPVLRIAGNPAPLRYILPPEFLVDPGGFRTVEDWETTDYYVVSIQQRNIHTWPANPYGATIEYLQGFTPRHTILIEGVRYVDIWDLNAIPPPPWLAGTERCQWQFSPWLQLKNVLLDDEEVTLWFQTVTAKNLPEGVIVTVELVPRGTDTPAVEKRWAVPFEPSPRRGLVTNVTLTIPELREGGADAFLVQLRVHSVATGMALPAYAPNSSVAETAAVVSIGCDSVSGASVGT